MNQFSEILWQDLQHRELFDIIQKINEHVTPALLKRLENYLSSHFVTEEEYMERFNYPRAKEHASAHDEFVLKVNLILNENPALDHQVGTELSSYLNIWLEEHVLGMDKDLESFLLKLDNPHNL